MKLNRLIPSVALTALLSVSINPAQAQEDPAATARSPQTGGQVAAGKTCAPGFFRVGATLCMTGAMGPDSFANALAECQWHGARVAGYGEWRYRVLYGDGVAAPQDWWLGPITADDRALYVNSTNVGNFEGETSRFETRFFACARN